MIPLFTDKGPSCQSTGGRDSPEGQLCLRTSRRDGKSGSGEPRRLSRKRCGSSSRAQARRVRIGKSFVESCVDSYLAAMLVPSSKASDLRRERRCLRSLPSRTFGHTPTKRCSACVSFWRFSSAYPSGKTSITTNPLCKFACNSDPLRGDFRVQFRPLLTFCVSVLPFGPDGPGRTLGDDWRGQDWPDTTRLF